MGTSAGAALQLSPSNKFHPHRLVFNGYVNGCRQAAPFASSAEAQRKRLHSWYTDDGENYHFAKNATGGPLCTEGIGEVGFAETPDGGLGFAATASSTAKEMQLPWTVRSTGRWRLVWGPWV